MTILCNFLLMVTWVPAWMVIHCKIMSMKAAITLTHSSNSFSQSYCRRFTVLHEFFTMIYFSVLIFYRISFLKLFFTRAVTPHLLRFFFIWYTVKYPGPVQMTVGSRILTRDSCVLCLVSPSCLSQLSHLIPLPNFPCPNFLYSDSHWSGFFCRCPLWNRLWFRIGFRSETTVNGKLT
jgi:hypothetical protein